MDPVVYLPAKKAEYPFFSQVRRYLLYSALFTNYRKEEKILYGIDVLDHRLIYSSWKSCPETMKCAEQYRFCRQEKAAKFL